jgi:diguanylate cyclase (GGDEF)-like protein/PAS domain S-box-containing protein
MISAAANILIVDDELQNRKLLEALLLPEGYRTISAANGDEALAAIAKQAPDLILLDAMMPGMDGYQVASTLKGNPATSGIPIIMVTAQIDRSARLAGLNAGAEEFLTKPVDRAELWLRVRNLLRLKEFSDFLANHSTILEQQVQERTGELQRFRAAMDATADAIYLVDRSTMSFIHVNDAACRMQNRTREELIALGPTMTLETSSADLERTYDDIIAGGEAKPTEILKSGADGSKSWIELRRHAQRSGDRWTIVALERDVTERKIAEGALHESEANYRSLIEQAADGIFLCDAKGTFVMVNSCGCSLLGYAEEELLGLNGVFTYPEEEREMHAARMQAVGAGKTLRYERMVQRKDATTFPAEISLKMLDNGLVQVILRDITHRHAQEQKISRLNRIHAVLSGINAAIVRIRDRRELFKEACRIIVEHGRFTLGWIAVLDHTTGKLRAVAQAGMSDSAGVGSPFFRDSDGLVPAETAEIALREKRAAIDNLIEHTPGLMNAAHDTDTTKVRQAAIRLGAKSVIVLPLIVERETFGLLTLYASEPNFFDDEELKLLNELAGDISFSLEFIAKEEKADYLAYYDALTGLANRALFLERVAQYMRSAVSGGHNIALFLIDLERFKNINDSLGQPAGDALLIQMAEWLTRSAGDANLLARVAADHFALVLPEVAHESGVARLIEKMLEALLEHPFVLNDAVFRIAAKVGAAMFPGDGATADALFKNAEAALKKAKAGGDRYLFYKQKMTEMVAGKLTLENQLRQALDEEQFVLHYQPKVTLERNKLTGVEALIRWNDPRTGLVAPGRFIPVLEETGLIYEVGRWALRQAIDDYLRWTRMGLAAVRVAVNVSPLQLRNRGFISEIKQVIGVNAGSATGLELEITESLIMEDVRHNISSLRAIRDMGINIAIDDFGTGFSSLSYLSKLPVDTLKIDRSFVIDMTSTQEGLALVSTIINLGHSLKLNVVAEGVETEEQSRLLRLLNCDEMQGYLFSKPVPSDILETRFLLPALAVPA